MNYTTLKTNVEDICEQTFTAAQHALFAQQAEQKIYNSVELPAMRTVDEGYGLPKFYAYHSTVGSNVRFLLAPTPDENYEIEHMYVKYPTSIVSAGGTYLGDNFDTALLNGTLMEAVRFMKGEPDVVAMYEKHYLLAIGLLQRIGDGKLRQDSYRSGQLRSPVS